MKDSEQKINIWFDEEGNNLTVTWAFQNGYYTDTDDDRVMVRVDMAGNVQGFQVDDLNSIRNEFVEAKHGMEWWEQLGKDKRGSRPRCVLLTDGSRDEVAQRLTKLVNLPEVAVCPDDLWMPRGKPVQEENGKWDKTPVKEAQLDKADNLAPDKIKQQLRDWWLAVPRNAATPNWDIASTCTIRGKPGLLLVEAKAHYDELSPKSDKCSSTSWANRERIGQAIAEATTGLSAGTEGAWSLSRDHHYQLSNRFAWAWKLAALGIPVALVYLGFIKAQDITGKKLFESEAEWESALKKYCSGVVDDGCWGQWLDIQETPLLPLIRTSCQQFCP